MAERPGAASARLTALLREENDALRRHDYTRAAAMLPAKQARAAEFTDDIGRRPEDAASPADIRILAELAAENRRLLAQAMRVQRRMLDTILAAARQTASRTAYPRLPRHHGPGETREISASTPRP